MKNLHRTGFLRLILTVLVAGVGFGGCVENRSSLTILRNAVPASDCTLAAGSEDFRSLGTLDLSETAFLVGAPKYEMYPVVQNNLISTVDQGTGAELNIIEVVEARVDLDAGSLPSNFETLQFSYPAFITLMPGDSAPLPVVVIPPQIAALFATDIQGDPYYQPLVRVSVKFLYQHGGMQHETHQIEYGVVLCDGCLLKAVAACSSGLYSSIENVGNACSYAQDVRMDCCLDSGGGVICPAVDTSVAE